MIPSPAPPDEAARLETLAALDILDTPPEPFFDSIVRAASAACGSPIALVSLVDEKRQWFKAKVGLEATQTPREFAFCAHAVHAHAALSVPDARADERFHDNPLVTGAPHVIAYHGAPLVTSTGRALGTLCVIHHEPTALTPTQFALLHDLARAVTDHIETRRAARAIAAQEARLSFAMRTLGAAVFEIDLRSGEVFASDGLPVFLRPRRRGRLPYEVAERVALEDRDRLLRAWTAHKKGGPPVGVDVRMQRADGELDWVRLALQLRRDESGRARTLMGVVKDIAYRKKQEVELARARDAAEAANRAKSEFLANMSHEIRTPLNGVTGLAGVLARTPLTGEQQEMVALIERSAALVERLVGDVLDFSKIEAGRLELEEADFDLADELSSAITLMRGRAHMKGLRCDVRLGPEVSGIVRGDALRIKQVLSNLLSNAVKFTETGGVSVDVRLEPRERADQVWLAVEVIDTGIGFDPQARDALFQRFAQADASIRRRFGGSGLGLAISDSLVKLMGGEMWARSKPGEGSAFGFRVPLQRRPSLSRSERESAVANVSLNGLKILGVEDHPINRRVLELALEPLGVELTLANDGVEGVAATAAQTFDLILMDMQMPEMDGLAATREIRRREQALGLPRTPIAMLSANALRGHREEAIAAGADDHVAKPITPESLVRGITRTLAAARAPRLRAAVR